MNKRLVIKILGIILLIEACAMAPSYVIALIYHDAGDAPALLYTIAILAFVGFVLCFFAKPRERNMRAREALLIASLSWVLLSAFGALPFVFSGMLPSYADALFEAVSGFTTTGATVLTDFDSLPHGVMFWRSFTHWIGGMGVLVLTLALIPRMSGRTAHLVRAESPGPSLSKIVPKMGDSAKILYIIYALLTAMQFFVLLLAGMNAYDAAIHAMGTAGTGGFSNYGASIAAFDSPLIEWIITFFMILYGINFALFFRVLIGEWRAALRSEELHWYLGIIGVSIAAITVLILPQCANFGQALRYSSFQVASVISTTGFATTDYNLWPQAAKTIILILMVIGSCAGSTAGGVKMVRFVTLCKLGKRSVVHTFQPRKVQVVRVEGKGMDESRLGEISVFFFVYFALVFAGMFLISLEGKYDLETNFTAALTCMSNVGPGFGAVGAVENFDGYNHFSKCVLSLLMLAGRLEMFPLLALAHPSIWHKS